MSQVWRFALSRRWWAGHVLVAAGCGLFLALANWQWDRAHSIAGDWQNFGYALQWPLFAVFLVAAWLRFLWLEQHVREPHLAQRHPERGDLTDPEHGRAGPEPGRAVRHIPARAPAPAGRPTEDDPDDELAAYNAYLARLAADDRRA